MGKCVGWSVLGAESALEFALFLHDRLFPLLGRIAFRRMLFAENTTGRVFTSRFRLRRLRP